MAAKERPYIVCTGANGRAVVYGYSTRKPVVGKPISLRRAKMVLRWTKTGLMGLAETGPEDGARLTHAVEETGCTVEQYLTVSETAAEKIDGWPSYYG